MLYGYILYFWKLLNLLWCNNLKSCTSRWFPSATDIPGLRVVLRGSETTVLCFLTIRNSAFVGNTWNIFPNSCNVHPPLYGLYHEPLKWSRAIILKDILLKNRHDRKLRTALWWQHGWVFLVVTLEDIVSQQWRLNLRHFSSLTLSCGESI